jgi:hypothetical protein
MICDFIARTNWSNIESNYFGNTITIFDLSYYTNITITVTFVKQAMLYHAFSFVSPENYLHESGAIFHINLYILSIHTEVPNSTNKLYHVKWLAVFQNKPFTLPDSRMNHLCRDWNKRVLTIGKITFCNCHAWWLPLINKRFVINKLVTISIIFFGLSVMNDAAKPDCILPIGDDGSLNGGRSSGELIVIEMNMESEYNSNLQIGMALSIK